MTSSMKPITDQEIALRSGSVCSGHAPRCGAYGRGAVILFRGHEADDDVAFDGNWLDYAADDQACDRDHWLREFDLLLGGRV